MNALFILIFLLAVVVLLYAIMNRSLNKNIRIVIIVVSAIFIFVALFMIVAAGLLIAVID